MNLSALPNLICVGRMILMIPVGHSILDGRYALAFWLCMIAAFSDVLDGQLAKRCGWMTELGKFLDPIADKLFMLTVFLTLMFTEVVPVWMGVLVIGRDVLIGAGAWTYKVLFGPVEGRPTLISKVNTGFQLSYAMASIGGAAGWFAPWFTQGVGTVMVLTTLVSGYDYTAHYIRKARAVVRARRAAAP